MTSQLLPPQNWDDFEQLCHSLWTNLLSDPETKMHGRRGQSQNGIDVYGSDFHMGRGQLVGVQCKGKDNYLERNLTEVELREEVGKATLFQPTISKFILATTGKRDVNIQAFTRTVNTENTNNGLFTVSTWSWPDISEEIQSYPTLLRKYYPENFVNPNFFKQPTNQAMVDEAISKKFPPVLNYLEKQVPDKEFLLGQSLGMADISIISMFITANYGGYNVDGTRWPKLAAYVARAMVHPVVAKCLENEKAMLKMITG